MRPPRVRVAAVLLAALLLEGCGLLARRKAGSSEPIDLNRAPVRAIEQLPGITPSMAARIVAGRPYDDPHALVERDILTPHELERIADRVVVRETDRRP